MRRKAGRLAIMILAVICIVLFGAAGSAKAQRQTAQEGRERRCREREEELLEQVRTYLADRGFSDSGVTLSRTVEEGRGRSYTVTVHHRRIDRMGGEERARLGGQLEEVCGSWFGSGSAERGRVECRFLLADDLPSGF